MNNRKAVKPFHGIPIYRVTLVKESTIDYQGEQYSSPDKVAPLLAKYFEGLDRECFVVLMLNSKNRIIGFNTVSIGSLNQAIVHPREVFKPAILCNSRAIIIAHNHPSGDPQPSQEDRAITARLKDVGGVLEIPVLDHIIMGDGSRYFSFTSEEQENKTLEEGKRKRWLLEQARQRFAKNKATSDDILLIGSYIIAGIWEVKLQDWPEYLGNVIKMISPLTERKKGRPRHVVEKAADLISKANACMEINREKQAA